MGQQWAGRSVAFTQGGQLSHLNTFSYLKVLAPHMLQRMHPFTPPLPPPHPTPTSCRRLRALGVPRADIEHHMGLAHGIQTLKKVGTWSSGCCLPGRRGP